MPGGPNGPMPGGPMGGMGGPNPMMVPCSKSSPMGMSGGPNGPDPTQPLPPSGLSGNGFNKNSPIMGGPNSSTTSSSSCTQPTPAAREGGWVARGTTRQVTRTGPTHHLASTKTGSLVAP